jgi:glycosyltransferase involved in cell wall biosynthesis
LSLVARLDRALPRTLPAGCSTSIFCVGACFHPQERIEQLEILTGGVAHKPAAFGMPRPDLAALRVPGTPDAVYHSGFWATVPLRTPQSPGTVELRILARLANGVDVTCPIGAIDVIAPEPPPICAAEPDRPGPGLIAVCMATFEPDLSLFAVQVQSLRDQTDERWICLISDDCSSDQRFEQIQEVVGGDRRFAVARADHRLGFYGNFERALSMVPPEAELVALCDQDDRWYPEKLAVLRRSLGRSVLVYSDQRLVAADGALLRDSLWRGRRNNHDNLASMLVANTITGAATLFRRDLLEVALPFPDTPGFQFHDHWLAVAALAAGDVAYVERPLYDYVQHRGAVFGDVTHGRADPDGKTRSSFRAAYFYGYLSREVQAQVLLTRCARLLSPRKLRALRLFIGCDSSIAALAWLAARPLRGLVGRTETLGTEVELVQGIVWKRLTAARARGRKAGGPFSDASLPPLASFSQKRLRRWRARVS